MQKINVAIFPCGSEVGMEINRALRYSRHFEVWGLNSEIDHGRMVFENYINHVPSFKESGFIGTLKNIVREREIRFLIPSMDEVAALLKEHEKELGCEVVCADKETIRLLTSKEKTYSKLKGVIPVPELYTEFKEIEKHLPVFTKPDVGYGSRNIDLVETKKQLVKRWEEQKKERILFCEYLPGDEYTIDCFSDVSHKVLFTGPRIRKRIRKGISVNTIPVELEGIEVIAQKISDSLGLKGAWFFQMKENKKGDLVLLEIASRVSGSMALYRLQGVNFVLLELFQCLGHTVNIAPCLLPDAELERSFDCKLKTSLEFDTVYVDFDDCILIEGKLNTQILQFLYQQINADKRVVLLTKHNGDLGKRLKALRIENLFDEVVHLEQSDWKYEYIREKDSIFIDDSHKEREEVMQRLNIPAFAPDAICSLIDYRKL